MRQWTSMPVAGFVAVVLCLPVAGCGAKSSAGLTSIDFSQEQLLGLLATPLSEAAVKKVREAKLENIYSDMFAQATDSEIVIGGVTFSGFRSYLLRHKEEFQAEAAAYKTMGEKMQAEGSGLSAKFTAASVKAVLIDLSHGLKASGSAALASYMYSQPAGPRRAPDVQQWDADGVLASDPVTTVDGKIANSGNPATEGKTAAALSRTDIEAFRASDHIVRPLALTNLEATLYGRMQDQHIRQDFVTNFLRDVAASRRLVYSSPAAGTHDYNSGSGRVDVSDLAGTK